MAAPIDIETRFAEKANGSLIASHRVSQEGPLADVSVRLTYDTTLVLWSQRSRGVLINASLAVPSVLQNAITAIENSASIQASASLHRAVETVNEAIMLATGRSRWYWLRPPGRNSRLN